MKDSVIPLERVEKAIRDAGEAGSRKGCGFHFELDTASSGDFVVQDLTAVYPGDIRERVYRQVLSLADKQVRDALIKMGWSPPGRLFPDPTGKGNVVVTTTEDGHCVAVTIQDEDGRIIGVLWEAFTPGNQTHCSDHVNDRAVHDGIG